MGGHVLQRASVDDGLKPYVSAQRGSNKHQSSPSCSMLAVFAGAGAASRSAQAGGARGAFTVVEHGMGQPDDACDELLLLHFGVHVGRGLLLPLLQGAAAGAVSGSGGGQRDLHRRNGKKWLGERPSCGGRGMGRG